jgi:hypothetical protein
MTTTVTVFGDGISMERDVSGATVPKIMETAMGQESHDGGPTVTVSLSGEGLEFDREVPETIGVEVIDLAVHDGTRTVGDSDERAEGELPDDFFDRLSEKQRVMLEILLDADGEWMRGTDIRREMRETYGLDVGDGGRATAGVIAGLTRKYDEEFRRAVIPGRWADETQQHAEFKLGEEYEAELREGLADR